MLVPVLRASSYFYMSKVMCLTASIKHRKKVYMHVRVNVHLAIKMCAYQPESTVSDGLGGGGYLLLHKLDENKNSVTHIPIARILAKINGLSTYTNIYSIKLIMIIYRRSWCFHNYYNTCGPGIAFIL